MHSTLYKKALINRNEGYGLGAVSYIRRVVEDKTEELIEVVAQLAGPHKIDPEKSVFEFAFTRLRAEIEEGKDFADKIKKWAGGNLPAAKTPKS